MSKTKTRNTPVYEYVLYQTGKYGTDPVDCCKTFHTAKESRKVYMAKMPGYRYTIGKERVNEAE